MRTAGLRSVDAAGARVPAPATRLGLWRGEDRADNLRRALAPALDSVDWASRRNVVVKPNLVAPHRPLAVTHPEALAVVLAEIRLRYDGRLVVAEGCAGQPTWQAFRDLGYVDIARRHAADLVDLNGDDGVPVHVYDSRRRPLVLRLARTIVDSDCRVSLTVPKTHDTVLVTLSIKNLVMGGLLAPRLARRDQDGHPAAARRLGRWLAAADSRLPWPAAGRSDKVRMHQGYGIMNVNLALLAAALLPDVAIVDGFEAMEGAGPENGTAVPWRVAFAGTAALAVDGLVAGLMGFPADQVGYLRYSADLGLGRLGPARDEVVGNVAPEAVARVFRPHPGHLAQRRWQRADAAELLAGIGR